MKKLLAAVTLLLTGCLAAFAGCAPAPGTYSVDASLSCYVAAMGGVEFGAPLMTDTEYNIAEDGTQTLTLYFTKSSVTIYSITCYTFIDPSPDAGEPEEGQPAYGTIGYYAGDTLVTDGVTYTLSEDTAPNNLQEEVHYVDSITFPITEKTETYTLTLYINSNVMGTQFTKDKYPATLTVDWDSVTAKEAA